MYIGLFVTCFVYIYIYVSNLLKYKINKVLPTIITDFGRLSITLFVCFILVFVLLEYWFILFLTCSVYNIFKI